MCDALKRSTRYFETYEAREEAFRVSAFSLIPRKHLGPARFWKDFRRISADAFLRSGATTVTVVTSNPRDCLSFGTGRQVLAAACLRSGRSGAPLDAAAVAEAFDITDLVNQPIRTLSGGESVKLALAKTFALADCSDRLVIASPFCWLSRDNAVFFTRLFDGYHHRNLPVNVLALEGEDSLEPVNDRERRSMRWDLPVRFSVRFEGVRLHMETSFNSLYAHETVAVVEDFLGDLSSPCLLVGGNGQGKSLVAKILARAVIFGGRAQLDRGGGPGPARLLFQDPVAQTLLRGFDAIAGSCNSASRPQAMAVYHDICAAFREMTGSEAAAGPEPVVPAGAVTPSFLQIKALLVAVRLCEGPCALILDEPDWGMSRTHAVAFVAAVIREAHRRGVPVLIISHKPWWRTIAADLVRVTRSKTAVVGKRRAAFRIVLQQDLGDAP